MKIPPVSLYPLRTFEDPDVVAPEYCYFEPARKPHWLNSIMNNQASQHDTTDDLPAPSAHKGSLAFILGPPTISTSAPVYPAQPLQYNQLSGSSGSETESDNDGNKTRAHPKRRRVSGANQQDDLASVRSQSPGKKGSKYCIVDGCTSRAKHARKCWKHGGSVKCKVTDCINRAKSKGVCWSHGGGTICSHAQCETIAVSHGFCWAHGGGKRCQVSGCSRPAYERTDNFCTTHHKQHLRGTLPQP